MIVVDTNIVAYLLIEGDHSEAARAVYRKDSQWAAPYLWRSEFRNVLATYLRRGDIALPDALGLFELARGLLKRREHLVASAEVLALVSSTALSAYDCEFLALANALDVPLVTEDRILLEKGKVAVSTAEFLAKPD